MNATSPPRKRKAARATDGLSHEITSPPSSFYPRCGASLCITEGVSPAMRVADLREVDRGLRRNLVHCYEREDWQGVRNQIGALEKCRMERRALMP